ncbi:MAG: hypothetical protein NTU53_13140 [Planctomycetota bacterium]|nr:hypothetical protein [Planctomycetota bacterium]
MTCDELRAYIDTTLADERSLQQMDQIRCHARQCPDCTTYLSELLQLERELDSLPSIPADADILANVMQRIGQESLQSPPKPANTIREAACWAAMLLGLSLSALAYSWSSSPAGWLRDCFTIRTEPRISGLIINLLQQPLPILIAGGLGLMLFTPALLWQGSWANEVSCCDGY